ncbi:diguanylate cyclase [Gudongella sp. DL1XJH-153]|uniref:diguanylate cyclase n=1 Tax=Gudongella sp. DL1XJH-153 TaxID=3409804 RepID=UPI003BB65C41
MKLINGEIRLIEKFDTENRDKAYIAEQLDNPGHKCFLKILDSYNHKTLIDNYFENIQLYKTIVHPGILSTLEFGRVDTINLKTASGEMYYILSDYTEWDSLDKNLDKFTFDTRVDILLRIIEAIDYLHFRELTYDVLSPDKVFVSSTGQVKLLNISSIVHMKQNRNSFKLISEYIAPESIKHGQGKNKSSDYWSIGVLIEKLLLSEIDKKNPDMSNFFYEIKEGLKSKENSKKSRTLGYYSEIIKEKSGIDYKRDLSLERERLYFEVTSIGFKKHLNNPNFRDPFNRTQGKGTSGLMVDGNSGTGKCRFVKELFRRRSLEGKKTYSVDIGQGEISSSDNFKTFLIQFCNQLDILNKVETESNNMELKIQGSDLSYNLDRLDSRLRLYTDLAEELARNSKTNTVFLGITNLQRADIEIYNFLDFIISKSAGRRVFFVFSVISDDIKGLRNDKYIKQWIKTGFFEVILLNNLTKVETYEYIYAILGNSNIPENLLRALYKESLGNPRYIRILLRHFIDRKVLQIDEDGNWTTTTDDYASVYYPTTFKKTIIKQINELNKDEMEFLKLLSCFDYPIEEEIPLQIMKTDEAGYKKLLQKLVKRRTVNTTNATNHLISFVEGDFKRQIHNDIKEEEKLGYHKSIADVLIARRNDNEVFNFESLILHLSASEQLDKMVEIVMQRVSKELNRYNDNSVNILKMCYRNLKGKNHQAKGIILQFIIEALITQGRFSECLEYIKTYNSHAKENKSISDLLTSEIMKLEIMLRSGDLSALEEQVKKCESLTLEAADPENRIHLLKLKAIMNQIMDNNYDSLLNIEDALEISEKEDIHDYDGDLYNLQGISFYLSGDHNKALESYHMAIEKFVISKRPFDRVKALNNIGNLYNEVTGEPKKALEYYARCLSISEENGLASFQTTFLNNLSEVHLTIGSYEDAELYIKKAIELSHLNGDRINEFQGTVYSGMLELAKQDLENASRIFLKVRDFNREDPVMEKEVIVHYLDFLASFYMEVGDYYLGKMFTRNAEEKSRGVNPKLQFRSSARIILINSIIQKKIEQEAVKEILNQFKIKGNEFEKGRFLIEMMHLSLILKDAENFSFLEREFSELDSEEAKSIHENDYNLLKLIQSGSAEKVLEATLIMEDKDCTFTQSLCRYHAYIGELLYINKSYNLSAAHLLRSIDLVQAKIDQIQINGYSKKILDNYNIESVTSTLDKVFKEGLGIESDKVDAIVFGENLIGNYLSLLDYNQYNELFIDRDKKSIPYTIQELILGFTDDHIENLEQILQYVMAESGATTGGIQIFGTEGQGRIDIPIGAGENISPIIEDILIEGEEILFNKGSNSFESEVSQEYFETSINGFIGVPIFEPSKMESNIERRSQKRKSKVYGYIYLQTGSGINRFDIYRLQLVKSMTNLVYLNMENKKLYLRSNFDKLTNVLSRESIENAMEEVIRTYNGIEDEFSVLMMDIDRFKDVNDTYGHQTGDQVLKRIGDLLNENTRTSDHVGRYGGEEFLIILENITKEDTIGIAEGIRKAIAGDKGFIVDRKVTVSIGISHYPVHGNSKEELIYKADQSLYYAKEILGRNSIAYWDVNMEEIEDIKNKSHKISMEVFERNQNGMVSLMDMAVLSRSGQSLNDKLFSFLGAINESIEAELSSILILEGDHVVDQFTREEVKSNWSDNIDLPSSLTVKVIDSRETLMTVNWSGAVQRQGDVDISSLKSIIISPIIIKDGVKAIVYSETSLRNKDFTSADITAVEVLGGVFSVNLV